MTLTFGSLFAGIGGFDLGLERAGMVCKWQVEIEPYARAVLKKHWPHVARHADVRTFPPEGEWGVDVICGGFPCQDISVAGKGAGLAGERSGLWHEYARIVGELRPRYVIVENVAALLTRGMDAVLGTLSSLGYDAEWHVIPASAVGAPHRRDRVWIVCVRRGDGEQADASRSDANGERSHKPKINFVGDAELRDEQDRVAGSVGGDVANADCESAAGSKLSCIAKRSDSSASSRPVEFGNAGGSGTCDRGSNVADATNDGREIGARLRADWQRTVSPKQGTGCGAACRTSEPVGRSGDVPDANGAGRQQQRRPESEPAEHAAAECGGWWSVEPDVGRVAHGVPSRVDRLRCLGNAVVPQIVEIIGRAIIERERGVA